MQITPARPADLPQINAMIRDLAAFHGEAATNTLENLQTALFGQGSNVVLVARDGDQLIGYAGLNIITSFHRDVPRIDIHHLFVAEAHRNHGIGRALIGAACALARAKGAPGMTIGTSAQNRTAQAAYRAMGLREQAEAGPRFWIPADEA